jgi:hypothetical protein
MKDKSLKLDYSLSHHNQNSFYVSDFYEAWQLIAFFNLIGNKTIAHHNITGGLTQRIPV